MELVVNGVTIQLSEAGWMEDMSQWNEDVAKAIARDVEKVELTDEHWVIINETRSYFHENGMVPEVRLFAKLMKEKYGSERATQPYFYALFPYGLLKSANKIAGLPRPKGCS